MTSRSLEVRSPIDLVWQELQSLATWEGIGGLTDLRNAVHAPDGTLQSFDFTIDTPLGEIRDAAKVESSEREMHITGTAKGVTISVDVELDPSDRSGTVINFAISAKGNSFLAKPLAATLGRVFEQSLDKERAVLARRLQQPG